MTWKNVVNYLPEKSGRYLTYAPGADPNNSIICVAWYEVPSSGNLPGWQLLLKTWCEAITHWMPLPEPPKGG